MIQFAEHSEPSLLVLSVAEEFGEGGSSSEIFAIPVLSRAKGFLVCIPRGGFSEELLVDAMTGGDPDAVLGPSKGISVNLVEEIDDGSLNVVGALSNCLLLDLSDAALPWVREYDPASDDNAILGFSTEYPHALPMRSEVVACANEWISTLGVERANFYSAQEEQEVPKAKDASRSKAPTSKRVTNAQVMDLISNLSAQVKLLTSRQDHFEKTGTGHAKVVGGQPFGNTANVPSVSAALGKDTPVLPPYSPFAKAANIVGPPPKVRGHQSVVVPVPTLLPTEGGGGETVGDPSIAVAISQQSAAVTALVAHLTNQADPLSELSGGGNLSSTTKGVQRREKMQQDLASGNSSYYFQVMCQVHKRMFPSKPLPRSESELGHISFLSYLEKTGGYRGAKEA